MEDPLSSSTCFGWSLSFRPDVFFLRTTVLRGFNLSRPLLGAGPLKEAGVKFTTADKPEKRRLQAEAQKCGKLETLAQKRLSFFFFFFFSKCFRMRQD